MLNKDIPLTIKANENNCEIAINKVGNPYSNNLQYRINKSTWQAYTYNTVLTLNKNDIIEFENNT
jgi:hypothetical protein